MTTTDQAVAAPQRSELSRALRHRANEIGLIVALVVLYVFLSLFAPNFFTAPCANASASALSDSRDAS